MNLKRPFTCWAFIFAIFTLHLPAHAQDAPFDLDECGRSRQCGWETLLGVSMIVGGLAALATPMIFGPRRAENSSLIGKIGLGMGPALISNSPRLGKLKLQFGQMLSKITPVSLETEASLTSFNTDVVFANVGISLGGRIFNQSQTRSPKGLFGESVLNLDVITGIRVDYEDEAIRPGIPLGIKVSSLFSPKVGVEVGGEYIPFIDFRNRIQLQGRLTALMGSPKKPQQGMRIGLAYYLDSTNISQNAHSIVLEIGGS